MKTDLLVDFNDAISATVDLSDHYNEFSVEFEKPEELGVKNPVVFTRVRGGANDGLMFTNDAPDADLLRAVARELIQTYCQYSGN